MAQLTSYITMLFKKRTPEDWYLWLCRTKDLHGLASTVLSQRQSFEDNVKILLVIPPSVANKTIDMRRLESTLEESGHVELAQIVRWHRFWESDTVNTDTFLQWSQKIVEADIKSRWILQRETYVQEEVHALQKSLAIDDKDDSTQSHQLGVYEAELEGLKTQSWAHKKHAWNLEGNVKPGFTTRVFRACREDPNWYLCPWLSQDCAGRGGCCGRGCGCCQKQTQHGQSRGHCTSACGCCVRTQGRNSDGKQTDMADFPFNIVSCRSAYSKRIFRAYIWRLTFLDEMGLCGIYW